MGASPLSIFGVALVPLLDKRTTRHEPHATHKKTPPMKHGRC